MDKKAILIHNDGGVQTIHLVSVGKGFVVINLGQNDLNQSPINEANVPIKLRHLCI